MKVISIILAFYTLSLTIFPCSDSKTCLDERKAGVSVSKQTHDHSNSEADFCTPFCNCSCCAAHVQIINLTFTTSANLVHNTQLVTPYMEKPIVNNGDSIWQPPKI